jgi:hypothetical protein
MCTLFSILQRMIACAMFLGLLLTPTLSQAVIIYGLRIVESPLTQSLVTFRPESPGTFLSERTISGLNAGERAKGLTFNPDNGLLYSIGQTASSRRLLTLNPDTGIVTTLGTSGPEFLFGETIALFPGDTGRIRAFNPIIEGDFITGQRNLLINRLTGVTTIASGNLEYVAGDTAFGAVPNVRALAFSNAHSDALVTTLYGIDFSRNTLVRVGDVNSSGEGSINGGDVRTIGGLGIGPGANPAMAIVPRSNLAYASVSTTVSATLYRINLSIGAASPVGAIGSPTGGGIYSIAIRDDNKCLDLDGDGRIRSTSDGLLLMRALLGLTGTSATENAIPPGPHPIDAVPLRSTWTAIRNHLNTRCGMDFAP